MNEITWAELTEGERNALKDVGIGHLEVTPRYMESRRRLVEMGLATLSVVKGDHITPLGREVLAQADAQTVGIVPTVEDDGEADAIILSRNLDHVSTQWVQFHLEMSKVLELDFEPEEDIERYSEAITAFRDENTRLRAALETIYNKVGDCSLADDCGDDKVVIAEIFDYLHAFRKEARST